MLFYFVILYYKLEILYIPLHSICCTELSMYQLFYKIAYSAACDEIQTRELLSCITSCCNVCLVYLQWIFLINNPEWSDIDSSLLKASDIYFKEKQENVKGNLLST